MVRDFDPLSGEKQLFPSLTGADLIEMQETHWTIDMETQVKCEWQDDVFCTHGTNSAQGTTS